MWRLLEPIKLVFLNNIILVFGVIVFRWDEVTLIMSLFTSMLVSLILLLFTSYRLRASILLLIYAICAPLLFIPSFEELGLVFKDMPWLQIGLISLAQLLLGLVNVKKLKDEAYSKSIWFSAIGSFGAIIFFGAFLFGAVGDIALDEAEAWLDIENIFASFIGIKIFFESYTLISKYKEGQKALEKESPVTHFFLPPLYFAITLGLVALFVWPYWEIKKSGDEGIKVFGAHIGATVNQKTELSTQPYIDSVNGFEITPPKLWLRTTTTIDDSKVNFYGLSLDYYHREGYWPYISVQVGEIDNKDGEQDVLLLAQSDLEDLATQAPRDFKDLGVEKVDIGNVPAAIYKYSCACSEDPNDPSKSVTLQLVAYNNDKIYTVGGSVLENVWTKHAEVLRASLLSLRFL